MLIISLLTIIVLCQLRVIVKIIILILSQIVVFLHILLVQIVLTIIRFAAIIYMRLLILLLAGGAVPIKLVLGLSVLIETETIHRIIF